MRHFRYLPILFILFFWSCKEKVTNTKVFTSADLVNANTKLLHIAMEDGFPPPIASRVYVYPHIAHYLALEYNYPDSLPALSKKLNGLPSFTFKSNNDALPELTALLSFCNVARKVVFSEYMIDELQQGILKKAKDGNISEKVIEASTENANAITSHLMEWIKNDNYIQTRTMDRWTSSKDPGKWRETPPDYQIGLEPNWDKMRQILTDSTDMYVPAPLPAYSPDVNSDFYKMVNKVYTTSMSLDSAKIATAWYWDDNPNTSEHRGHAVAIIHKVSPPGHWLNIISGIINAQKDNIFKSTKAYTFSAIAMYDGIISCWYQKYKTNLVRPVSYIQEYIDVNWNPLIQTPPFPEYTSGHSVISASAATVLNSIYGSDLAFVDSTQTLFGLAPRTFENFDQAAWEVSLSRFYGGIHFYNGIEEGNKQGKFIGNAVINKLK